MVDFKKAIEIAKEHLTKQGVEVSISEDDCKVIYDRALEHTQAVLIPEITSTIPLDERGLAGALFGYYYTKNVKAKSYLTVPFGPTTIEVSMDDIHNVFYYFNNLNDFLDHCPDVKYWNVFSQKNSEGTDLIVNTAPEEAKAGLYFYSGYFLFVDEYFTEFKRNGAQSYDPSSLLTTSGVNEELKAKILDLDPTLITKHLNKIDSYKDTKPEQYLLGTTKSMNIGIYDLFKGQINRVDVAFVRCYCPSTDRMFLLEVEDKHTNAKDAIASLAQVPRVLKDKVLYIQRNGEVFHMATSNETREEINSGKYSQEELADLVSFTGEEYFSLMRAEY
jgi:hypothetical protein